MRVLTPAFFAARMLIPTASINMPSAVFRVSSQNTTSVSSAIITGVGNSNSEPLPSQESSGELKVTICPEVINCATPRPATIRISVATNGWILRMATRTPFHNPARMPEPKAASSTTGRLCPATVIAAVVAPAMAITAPTERSMPPVAITSVIPIANSATGAARLRISIGLPNRRPSCKIT